MNDVENIGKVKWFNTQKGFGFITRDDGQDVFFHHTQVDFEIQDGMEVSFELIKSSKANGLRAAKLKPHGDHAEVIATDTTDSIDINTAATEEFKEFEEELEEAGH